ncbi:MAG: hypothetical protein Q9221_006869 [Calogaya cf. arnoldii]
MPSSLRSGSSQPPKKYHYSLPLFLALAPSTKHDVPEPFPTTQTTSVAKKTQIIPSCCSIISAAIGLVYANYLYQSYIIGEFAAFPEPVARKLRRALYYSNYDIQPENALKYYKQALAVAEEIGMDPFSDEILGVKFQLASFFENRIHRPRMAIEILERVRKSCLDFIGDGEIGGEMKDRGKRTRVLGQCVRMSAKLGELYAGPEIMEAEQAEESLVWAVTTH